MTRRLGLLIGLTALISASLLTPVAMARSAMAAAPAGADLNAVPVTGTTQNGGTLAGTLDINRFAVQGGQLVAVGTLTATITDALGNVVGMVTQNVTIPVAASGSCQILHLVLGPLDLDLLGLQVHLNQVVLDITAQSGPGNLLGNLLCAVAGLLDNGLNLNGVAQLLNQILRILG
jgi:hypothetical protein